MVSSLIGGASVSESVPLAPLMTLRVGPVARRLITCDTTQKIVDVTRVLGPDSDALVLAGGSNVVLADELADLDVVLLANTEITVEGNVVRAEAGATWDDVVVTSLAHGLGGLECLSGIPGSAGATPVQNVGAYGAEVADTIRRVRLLDRRTGEDRWVQPSTLQFGYRTSVLKHSAAAIVVEVEFELDPDGRSAPLRYGELAMRLAHNWILGWTRRSCARRYWRCGLARGWFSTMPTTTPGASGRSSPTPLSPPAVFEQLKGRVDGDVPNYPAPGGVKLAAGWLVERAGFAKGYPGDGAPARLSTKHALALTNRGGATTADVIALARAVRDGVGTTFGIELTPEPILIGAVL